MFIRSDSPVIESVESAWVMRYIDSGSDALDTSFEDHIFLKLAIRWCSELWRFRRKYSYCGSQHFESMDQSWYTQNLFVFVDTICR